MVTDASEIFLPSGKHMVRTRIQVRTPHDCPLVILHDGRPQNDQFLSPFDVYAEAEWIRLLRVNAKFVFSRRYLYEKRHTS